MPKKFSAGVKGPFKKHIENNDNLSSLETAIFEDAVEEAYGDAKRTFEGINGRAEEANRKLAQKIKNYFRDANNAKLTERAFDELHGKWCTEYLGDLKGKKYNKATYGQSQKVVNMTFKYLYCLNDATTNYNDYFRHCHVALDSFTLEWIWRHGNLEYPKPKYNRKKHNSYDAWSNIEKNDYQDTNKTNRPGYDTIETMFRNCIPAKKYSNCTPFQAEFTFWEDIKQHLAAEEFYSSLPGTISADDFKNYSLQQKYGEIKKLI